jgi:hypothetical protein
MKTNNKETLEWYQSTVNIQLPYYVKQRDNVDDSYCKELYQEKINYYLKLIKVNNLVNPLI